MQNSDIARGVYVIQPVAPPPQPTPSVTFTPPAGTYASPQSVTLSDTDANARIYYTIDGSTPSASSTLYFGAIQVSTSMTINALAIDPAMQNSDIARGVYVIQPVASPTPSFGMSVSPLTTINAGTSSTSTITITPSGGFTGDVSLACALTASPSSAKNVPVCSIDQSATIAGTQPATATLTIRTTGAPTAAVRKPFRDFVAYGGEALTAFLLFCFIPIRRRRWQSLIGIVLLGWLFTAATGCGGISKPTATLTPGTGTTPGNYVITVTGTSGTITTTAAVPFAVQ